MLFAGSSFVVSCVKEKESMSNAPHEVLQSVLKPSRYTGGEWNAVHKDWEETLCHWALALPDVYEVGMSNLGLAILYEILNSEEKVAAERVYAPWTDMEEEMRSRKMPLFSLESKHEIAAFDLLGFSLQYEMIYSNVLNMLDLAGIPIWAKDRSEEMPFIVGGGPCVYNVEPLADFFDFFIIIFYVLLCGTAFSQSFFWFIIGLKVFVFHNIVFYIFFANIYLFVFYCFFERIFHNFLPIQYYI